MAKEFKISTLRLKELEQELFYLCLLYTSRCV